MLRNVIAAAAMAATGAAMAATGYLVGQSNQVVAGELYTVCTYDVMGTRIDRLHKGMIMCPMTMTM